MKIRLPRLQKHIRTALEQKHERDVTDAIHGRIAVRMEPRSFSNAIGKGLQTEMLCAGEATVVRTYLDLKCEIIAASAEK